MKLTFEPNADLDTHDIIRMLPTPGAGYVVGVKTPDGTRCTIMFSGWEPQREDEGEDVAHDRRVVMLCGFEWSERSPYGGTAAVRIPFDADGYELEVY